MNFPLTLGNEGQRWSVGVDGDTMWVEWGRRDGKTQRSVRTYSEGKQGRTASQQARFEAESAARKKMRLGYTPLGHGATPPAPQPADEPPLPMLATDWAKYNRRERWVSETVLLQPKLDGIRCVADTATGALFSRTGKPILGLDHICAALRLAADAAHPPARWVDGEIFGHGLGFQTIVSAARRTVGAPSDAAGSLQLHVFDIVAADQPCHVRCDLYRRWIGAAHGLVTPGRLDSLRAVPTDVVEPLANVEAVCAAIDAARERYEAEGYEGAIARLGRGLYATRKRSLELVKSKAFEQEEFLVLGVEERAKQPGVASAVVCTTASGQRFRATPESSTDDKRDMWTNRGRYADGTWFATVRFQEYTDDGVPRFPVCVGMRHHHDV